MSKRSLTLVAFFLMVFAAFVRATDNTAITQDELVRRTQELYDAVAVGDQEPWRQYYAEDAIYFDEKGRSFEKSSLVADVTPLPKGYSGSIKLVNPKSRILGNTAILSYDLNEKETIFGQDMTARYHGTDTWLCRDGKWQIIAGQMLRYYEDPAPGKVNIAAYKDYVGTYELASGITRVVTANQQELTVQRSGRTRETLVLEAPDIFFRKGVEGRILFRRDEAGRVDALIDRRNNEDIVWQRIGT